MRRALAVAGEAATSGDVPVGAVVLDSAGQILAVGGNEREMRADVSAHAEIVAMRRAGQMLGDGWRLPGCTLVVTLEPCPMCAGAIVAARIHRLVFGAFDPKAGAVTSLWDLLRDPRINHRVEVVSGVMAGQAQAQLQEFFQHKRS